MDGVAAEKSVQLAVCEYPSRALLFDVLGDNEDTDWQDIKQVGQLLLLLLTLTVFEEQSSFLSIVHVKKEHEGHAN